MIERAYYPAGVSTSDFVDKREEVEDPTLGELLAEHWNDAKTDKFHADVMAEWDLSIGEQFIEYLLACRENHPCAEELAWRLLAEMSVQTRAYLKRKGIRV